jgi:hypothetical protein
MPPKEMNLEIPYRIRERRCFKGNRFPFKILRDKVRAQRRKERIESRSVRVYHVSATIRDLERLKSSRSRFDGAALDTGAQRSVIGIRQARACARMVQSIFELLPSRRMFKFGDSCFRSMGSIRIEIPCPSETIEVHVPFLIGLDLMDKHRLQFLSVSNELY